MTRLVRPTLSLVALVVAGSAPSAWCQTIVYRPVVPMFAPAAGPYVANYAPMGNYAAVTAFSPPVVHAAPLASVPVPVVDTVPSSSLGNTGVMPLAMSPLPTYAQAYAPIQPYRAAQPYSAARPITTYYAPSYAQSGYAVPLASPVGYATPLSGATTYATSATFPTSATVVTAGYAAAPAATAAIPMVPVAPSAVVVPLRRGLFGGYRPMRGTAVYPVW